MTAFADGVSTVAVRDVSARVLAIPRASLPGLGTLGLVLLPWRRWIAADDPAGHGPFPDSCAI